MNKGLNKTKKKQKQKQKFIKLSCSPKTNKKNKTCYSNNSLIKIKNMWNKRHPEKKIKSNNLKKIWNVLKNNMSDKCNNEACWLKQKFMENNLDDELINNTFAPKSPSSWLKNKNEWLSNFDISDVMKQYEKEYKNFIFIGPTPIDFDKRKMYNQCVWNDLCNFTLDEQLKNDKKYIGIIFNTDPHWAGGSHWISLFINIPKKYIFFFDSNGDKIPNEIKNLCDRIIDQANKLNIELKYIDSYGIEHQLKNTECGVYSLYLISSLLTGVHNPNYFIKNIIRDEEMEKYRNKFFNSFNLM